MATSREYGYYIRGNKLAIVEKDWRYGDGQTLSSPGINDVGKSGDNYWKSPTETISDGIFLEYTVMPKATDGGEITDESDTIDVSNYIKRALIYYLKARIAEDSMNIELHEYMMRKFTKMIEKYNNNKIVGPRRTMTGQHAIR
jgi:hypothetical protein